jgi:hypothetical protein
VVLAKTPLRLERLYIEGDRDSLCGMPSEISQIQCGDLLCLKQLVVNSLQFIYQTFRASCGKGRQSCLTRLRGGQKTVAPGGMFAHEGSLALDG